MDNMDDDDDNNNNDEDNKIMIKINEHEWWQKNDSNDEWWRMTTVHDMIFSMICNGKFQLKRRDKQKNNTNIQPPPPTSNNKNNNKEQTTTTTTTTTRLHVLQVLSHLDQGARYEPTSLVRNTSGTVLWRLNQGSRVSRWAIKKPQVNWCFRLVLQDSRNPIWRVRLAHISLGFDLNAKFTTLKRQPTG